MRHGDVLDAEEDENLVEGWEIGDEMGQDGRNSGHEFGVDEPDSSDTDDPEFGARTEEPIEGDFVLFIKLIPFERAVMPDGHDDEEDGGEDDGDPGAIEKLDQCG